MRRECHQVLRIERIAHDLGMSGSGCHYQFKAVTGMSPVQFQKQLRLQEARRLMVQDGQVATTAGRLARYGSLSQFNQEYRRQFGEPPLRDSARLRLSPSRVF